MVSKAIVKKANDFGDSIGRLDRIELENFKSYKVVLLLLLLLFYGMVRWVFLKWKTSRRVQKQLRLR